MDFEYELEINMIVLQKELQESINGLNAVQSKIHEHMDREDDIYYCENILYSINIKEYEKELRKIERIYSFIKKKYKNLSEDDFTNKYGKKIADIKNMLEEVKSEKAMIEPEFEMIYNEEKNKKDLGELVKKTNAMIDSCNIDFDNKIERAEKICRVNEEFWDYAFDENNQKLGRMTVMLEFEKEKQNKIEKRFEFTSESEYIEIIVSRLEYKLYKLLNIDLEYILRKKGLWKNEWDIWKIKNLKNHGKVYAKISSIYGIEFEFKEGGISLEELNKTKKRIKKKQERAVKHPDIYNRRGVICDNKNETLAVDITQMEMLQLNLDPSEFGWKEIKKPKVSSTDIARASKERGVKKSLIGQIASIFSRKKEDREI